MPAAAAAAVMMNTILKREKSERKKTNREEWKLSQYVLLQSVFSIRQGRRSNEGRRRLAIGQQQQQKQQAQIKQTTKHFIE